MFSLTFKNEQSQHIAERFLRIEIHVDVAVDIDASLFAYIPHYLFQNKNMGLVIRRLFGLVQYFILFTINCVVARQLVFDKMDEGKLFLNSLIYGNFSTILFTQCIIYLYFAILHQCYLLDDSYSTVDDSSMIWKELQNDEVIHLERPKRSDCSLCIPLYC